MGKEAMPNLCYLLEEPIFRKTYWQMCSQAPETSWRSDQSAQARTFSSRRTRSRPPDYAGARHRRHGAWRHAPSGDKELAGLRWRRGVEPLFNYRCAVYAAAVEIAVLPMEARVYPRLQETAMIEHGCGKVVVFGFSDSDFAFCFALGSTRGRAPTPDQEDASLYTPTPTSSGDRGGRWEPCVVSGDFASSTIQKSTRPPGTTGTPMRSWM